MGINTILYADYSFAQNVVDQPDKLYAKIHYTTQNGLPINSISYVGIDRDGYVWMTTYNGIVRFNGITFKEYNTTNVPQLPSNRFVKLRSWGDGTIFFQTEQKDLVAFKNGNFKWINSDSLKQQLKIFSYDRAADGTFYFGTDKGLYTYEGEKLEKFLPDLVTEDVQAVAIDSEGRIFYSQPDAKLYMWNAGELSLIAKKGNKYYFEISLAESDSRTWITWADQIIAVGQNIERYKPERSTQEYYSGLVIGPRDSLYLATFGGIFRSDLSLQSPLQQISDGRSVYIKPFVKDKSGNIYSITQKAIYKNGSKIFETKSIINQARLDHEDSMWIATRDAGLFQLKETQFLAVDFNKDLPLSNIYPLMLDDLNNIWMGTYGNGIWKSNNGVVKRIQTNAKKDLFVLSLVQLRDGRILAGTLGQGLFVKNKRENSFKHLTFPGEHDIYYNQNLKALYQDSSGYIYIGFKDGVFRSIAPDRLTFERLDIARGIEVRYIWEAPDSTIWLGTNGDGLIRYRDGTTTFLSEADGLNSDLIRNIWPDTVSYENRAEDYRFWVVTENKGLTRITAQGDSLLFESVRKQDGLPTNNIHQIIPDEYQMLWIGTNKGVIKAPLKSMNRFLKADTSRIDARMVNIIDHMNRPEINGGVQPTGFKDPRTGHIWLPSQEGAIRLDPLKKFYGEERLPLIIEKIDYLGTRESKSIHEDTLYVPAQKRNFQISFATLSYRSTSSNSYRFRLKNFVDQWTEKSARHTATYTQVPAGWYRFEVQSDDGSGNWRGENSIVLRVEPYNYERLLFKLGVGFAIVGLVFFLFRRRVGQIRKNELKLSRMVNERTHKLEQQNKKTSEQADLIQRIDQQRARLITDLSHELITPATLITSYIEKMREEAENLPEESQNKLRNIEEIITKMVKVTDDLRKSARISDIHSDINISNVNIERFIAKLADKFDSLAVQRGISLDINIQNEHSFIDIDAEKVRRIIVNILSISLTYTNSGGLVVLDVNESGDIFMIKVADTGTDISKKDLLGAFDENKPEEMDRDDAVSRNRVGITYIKSLIDLLNGYITVDQTEGNGSVFTILLPLNEYELTEQDIKNVEKNNQSGLIKEFEINQGKNSINIEEERDNTGEFEDKEHDFDSNTPDKPLILIVEDQDAITHLLSSLLETNYNTMTAPDGEKALEIIEEYPPDLILTDIVMPVMDGIAFIKKVREQTFLSYIPVIFLSGKRDEETQKEALNVGGSVYIKKPFSNEVVLYQIRSLLKTVPKDKLSNRTDDNENLEDIRPPVKIDDDFGKKLFRHINDHYNDPDFKVKHLADLLYIDRSQLYRKTKKMCNKTPSGIILYYRISYAKKLLKSGDHTISEIAYMAGFNSVSYFSTTFKKYEGHTPTSYLQADN